jgi:hypothetical protein
MPSTTPAAVFTPSSLPAVSSSTTGSGSPSMAAWAACCACSSSPSELARYRSSRSAMVLNSAASWAISSRPITRARAFRSPCPKRRTAAPTMATGRSMRVVRPMDASRPSSAASSTAATASAWNCSARRWVPSLLRTMASRLMVEMVSAPAITRARGGASSRR